jgi:poly-beta-1,6-N-acetyl-D-glucosamine synthase
MMDAIRNLALISAIGLAITWIGYPIVIGLFGMVRPRLRVAGGVFRPRLTVVLASREPTPAIRERIENLLQTGYPLDRVDIIVSHETDTAPPDLSGLNAPCRVAAVAADAPGGKAAALNAGVRAATGECIVLADTYQRFEPTTIPRLIDALEPPAIAASTGSYDLATDSRGMVAAYWRFEKWLRRAESRVHSPVGATGAVYAIRRSAWKPLPPGLILDDVFGPMQIVLDGHRVAFVDGARARELRTPTPSQEYGRKVRTLTGVFQLCAWLPAVLVPGRNPIWIQFVCHKLLRLLTPYFALFIGLWAIVAAGSLVPRVSPVLLAGALSLAVLAFVADRRGRIRRIIVEGALIQKAIVVAGLNGVRRNWQVW